jgi:Tfp pilus assembly protein PilF
MSPLSAACLALALAVFSASPATRAAPHIPAHDNVIVEKLPVRANDPAVRHLRELRSAHTAAPDNRDVAVRLARSYFDLASAEGDPRYVGYAEAALRPWTTLPAPPTDVILMRALIRQYRHDFGPALRDLDAVISAEPGNTEALQWQFALHLVQADYAAARQRCTALAPLTTPLAATACTAILDGINGQSRQAYARLAAALALRTSTSTGTGTGAGAGAIDADYRQWLLTRLGEMALRAGNKTQAEKHFREAIATGVTDGFVLAAYADLLLEEKRPAEVVTLLKDWVASDILLLRLALAEQALRAPLAAAHQQALADRFAAAALRGDKLHQQEESRFALQLQGDAAKALALAVENWTSQREPRDARVLMEAALAHGDAAAAKPALDWMASTGFEEPRYRELAAALARLPAHGASGTATGAKP